MKILFNHTIRARNITLKHAEFSATNKQNNTRYQIIWLLGTCCLIWLMIMLGGATRLTRAGLSIVEWKPITGILPPLSERLGSRNFSNINSFRNIKIINFQMTLSEFKLFSLWNMRIDY